MKNSNAFQSAFIFMAITALVQIFGLVRYLDRLPEDWLGIGLYVATIVALVIASFGFYVKWRQEN